MQNNFYNSIGAKAVVVGVLTLLLLIPLLFVGNLVNERQERYKEAIAEVSSKWGSAQEIAGPILVVPYMAIENIPEFNNNGQQISTTRRVEKNAYFLPETLDYKTTVESETKKRGIYDVAVYSLNMDVSGTFLKPDFTSLGIAQQDLLLNKAYVVLGLSDTRGIKEEIKLNWGDSQINFLPGTNAVVFPQTYDVTPVYNDDFGMSETSVARDASIKYNPNQSIVGVHAPVSIGGAPTIAFSFNTTLLGTNKLNFYPLGKTTTASVNSTWTSPSFDGNILPESSDNDENSENGFMANWKTSYFSRGVAQSFVGGQTEVAQQIGQIQQKKFGLTFKIPVDFYQKTERAVKYGILFVGLTFLVFFCFEVLGTNRKRIHALQYVLIGLAMVIFYLLLLSLSEYIGFNFSYILSALMTIGLVSWYSLNVLKSKKSATLVGLMLLVVYAYLFTLLQLQDFALLLGSLATFFILATLMYITRKIDWYKNE